jgi:hypothetical protein
MPVPAGIITKAVVDAEPLLNAIVLNYVRNSVNTRRSSILNASRISPYLRNEYTQSAFLRLFDNIRVLLTTSHVIGELQGLSQKLKGDYRQGFWLSGMQWLKTKQLDERLITLLAMHEEERLSDSICQIGPVDTGLIRLAQQEGCKLLTDDRKTLATRALYLGVDCILVEEYIKP